MRDVDPRIEMEGKQARSRQRRLSLAEPYYAINKFSVN